jgi:hypothetical protein
METASERITHKLWVGTLPVDDPVKTYGGLGSGLKCDGCDGLILSNGPELEVDMPDARTLRFHVACAGLWRVLKQALPDRKHAPPPSSSL